MNEYGEILRNWLAADDRLFDATIYARFEDNPKQLSLSEFVAAVQRRSVPVTAFVQVVQDSPMESARLPDAG